jgi:hypothetical protein
MSSYKINPNLSLMIPRVFPQWTNEQHIMDVFHKQDIGKVFKVDIIRTPDEPGRHYPIYQAFIYFSVWYENEIAYHFQQRIYNSENKQTKVVYDDPWFWVVFENKSKKNALSKEDIRMMKMERKSYEIEQRLNEQGQCIQQLQECVLLTTTAMNDSIAAATVAPMDERKPYPEDDYIQWAIQPNGTWDECEDETEGCDACDVMTCCDHMKRVLPVTLSHIDESQPYPARPRSNWFECNQHKCELGTKHDTFGNCKIYGCKTCCNACDMSACSKHVI